jgi:beta-mannosidase
MGRGDGESGVGNRESETRNRPQTPDPVGDTRNPKPDTRVCLELDANVENLHPWSERGCTLEISIQPPDGGKAIERRFAIDALPGRIPVRDLIEVPKAKLWWPNGMGEQPLYEVTATVMDSKGTVCDRKKLHIGLRTIEIDRTHLAEGSRFCVRVNGRDVFCRGGNLGPQDAILARVTDAKYQTLVAEAKNANFTMFRVNGVAEFEGEAFYDACDRAGILVWQDFPFSCTTYPDYDPAFREAVRVETEAAVRQLRHHPSLALWCGSNECIWGLCDWYNGDRSKPLELGGSVIYNQILPDACRQLDPRRPYWPGSPCGGDDPGSELSGDCHWWNAYLSNDPIRRVRHQVFDECRGRFVSEWGVPGPCDMDSIREYLAPDEMKLGTPAYQMHENQIAWDTLSVGIPHFYAETDKLSLAEYVDYGQMVQAMALGGDMEALRFRKLDPKDDCAGALIWAYSDCWGETGWSQLDYYMRRKASYYAVRRACAPVKVIVRQRGDKLVTRLVNDTMKPVSATVEVGWWRLDGSAREVNSRRVRVPADGMSEVATAAIAPPEKRDPKQWLYAAVLRGADGVATDQCIWTLAPFRELSTAKSDIRVTPRPDGTLEVVSATYAHAVHLDDHGHEVISDNWFDLLPGVPARVRLAKGVRPDGVRLEAISAR